MSLRVQNLTAGVTWVMKIKGERKGEKALVKACDYQSNFFGVMFEKDRDSKKVTTHCDPEEFIILNAPPGAVPRNNG